MKINKSAKSSKKPLVITAAVVVLAICSYLAVANAQGIWPFADKSSSDKSGHEAKPRVSDENDTPEAAQKNPEAPSQSTDRPDNTSSKDLTPGNTEDTSGKPLPPEISHATQSGSSIEVVATFSSTANGSCLLTLSKPGAQSIHRESPITVGPSYYLCGFTVEDSPGNDWTATVTHSYNGKQSDSVSQKVQ